jgi:murein DD-endopeptidase MepM/ murein hydrolase activator NlpD
MVSLAEFRNPTPGNNGSTWDAGHFYSARDPAAAIFDPAVNGRAHAGFDQGAPLGSPIVAPAAGAVAVIDFNPGAGNWIAIAHDVGGRTLFSRHLHCLSGFPVRVGERVDGGQPIARVGSTGSSDAPHNHTELLWDQPQAAWSVGLHIDPEYTYFGRTPANQHGGPAMIQALQQALADAGYDPGPMDGQFGPATQRALTEALSTPAATPSAAVLAEGIPDHRHVNRFAGTTGGVVRQA